MTGNNKNLFFTDFDSNHQTQLFKINLENKDKQQLTTDFSSIDYLKLDEEREKVYMRVLLNGDRNFHIAVYDLKSKEMNVWNSDEKDTSVKNFNVSPNGNVYVLSFSKQSRIKI